MTKEQIVVEISLHFPELLIIRKYVKIWLKNRGSWYRVLGYRDQKDKKYYKI